MQKVGVTASEMLELRNQGYGNHDIVAMLGISAATVRRYIGKQGKRMQRLVAFEDKPARKDEEQTPPQIEAYAPKPISEQYSIGEFGDGGYVTVEIDHIAEIVNISSLAGDISLTYEQTRELLRFLVWASRERCTEVNNDAGL